MRRITGTTSLLIGVLSLTMWTAVAAQQAKSPYIKASGAAFGNADAISQDELKTYRVLPLVRPARGPQRSVARVRHRGALHRQPPEGMGPQTRGAPTATDGRCSRT